MAETLQGLHHPAAQAPPRLQLQHARRLGALAGLHGRASLQRSSKRLSGMVCSSRGLSAASQAHDVEPQALRVVQSMHCCTNRTWRRHGTASHNRHACLEHDQHLQQQSTSTSSLPGQVAKLAQPLHHTEPVHSQRSAVSDKKGTTSCCPAVALRSKGAFAGGLLLYCCCQ